MRLRNCDEQCFSSSAALLCEMRSNGPGCTRGSSLDDQVVRADAAPPPAIALAPATGVADNWQRRDGGSLSASAQLQACRTQLLKAS